MSTLKATNLQHASATSPNITLGSDGSVAVGGGNISPQTGFRNRVINGDMRIDQRNNGASVTPVDSQYTLDRWIWQQVTAGKCTVQQSTTAPSGFTQSALVTSTSAYTPLTGDVMTLGQRIEGFNVSDLAWGTSNAQPVTISFWVRSSLTGTFGGTLRNSNASRSYPFTFSISAANTWEYKTVTVAGDTSGTWAANNTAGIQLSFAFGCGATYKGTPGSWASAAYYSATGAVDLVATNGATFYITGVQLEKGTVATPFEFRSYGQELALCQRYYFKNTGNNNAGLGSGYFDTSTVFYSNVKFPMSMRSSPTLSINNLRTVGTVSPSISSIAGQVITPDSGTIWFLLSSSGNAGQGGLLASAGTGGYIDGTSEL